jgi:hypothetical protein
VVAGALGLAWVALWLLAYQSPDKHKALSDAERDLIASGQETHLEDAGAKPSMLSLLGRRNFWGIALPRFLADPTWGTLSFWIPLYLTTVRHFDLKQIALFAWLPFVAADLGCLFGPAVVLFLQKRGVSLINARRGAFTLGAVMMTGMMFVGRVESPYVAIALLCLGGFAHQTLSVTVITMSSDLFRKNEVATVAGMAGFFGNLGVLIFSLLIGGLVASVGYDPFFVALGVLDLAGADPAVDPGPRPAAARRQAPSPFPPCRAFHAASADLQPDPAGLQSRPVDRPRRRGLLHRHLDLRVVPGRADPPFARPGELAAADRRPLTRASQLNMLGAPDSCGVWAPCLTHADGKFWLIYTDVKRYGRTTVGGASGASLRDFHNYLVTADDIEGPWSDPVFLNSSGFDPSLFHDDDGRKWLLNQLWDHRPGRNRFAGIVAQEYDPAARPWSASARTSSPARPWA